MCDQREMLQEVLPEDDLALGDVGLNEAFAMARELDHLALGPRKPKQIQRLEEREKVIDLHLEIRDQVRQLGPPELVWSRASSTPSICAIRAGGRRCAMFRARAGPAPAADMVA
jgi:hypothetical protein